MSNQTINKLQEELIQKETLLEKAKEDLIEYSNLHLGVSQKSSEQEGQINQSFKKIQKAEALLTELEDLETLCGRFAEIPINSLPQDLGIEESQFKKIQKSVAIQQDYTQGEKDKLYQALSKWQSNEVEAISQQQEKVNELNSDQEFFNKETTQLQSNISILETEIAEIKTKIKTLNPEALTESELIKQQVEEQLNNKLNEFTLKKETKEAICIFGVNDGIKTIAESRVFFEFRKVAIGENEYWVLNSIKNEPIKSSVISLGFKAETSYIYDPGKSFTSNFSVKLVASTGEIKLTTHNSNGAKTLKEKSSGWNLGASGGYSPGDAGGLGLTGNVGYESKESQSIENTDITNVTYEVTSKGSLTSAYVRYSCVSKKENTEITQQSGSNTYIEFDNIQHEVQDLLQKSIDAKTSYIRLLGYFSDSKLLDLF